MLDELPILLVKLLRRGRDHAEMFLGWLREVALGSGPRLRVVVSGSIGLAPIAARAGLSGTLNHYRTYPLPAWDDDLGRRCLVALGNHYGLTWELGADAAVVSHLGSCIPFHVQLFFQLLHEDAERRKTRTLSVGDVARVYQTRMLSSYGHAELAHMEERLAEAVAEGHRPFAIELLTEAAVVGRLTARAALHLAGDGGLDRVALRDVLEVLVHDGYLDRDGVEHHFSSKLLREWWAARHSTFYVPSGDRR